MEEDSVPTSDEFDGARSCRPSVTSAFSAPRVIGLFLLLLAVLHGLYQAERRLLDGQLVDLPYTRFVTLAAEGLGNILLPFDIERRGDVTLGTHPNATHDPTSADYVGNTTVVIRGGCNGIEALLLMLAGVLALPAPWAMRLRVLACNLPILFALNLLRILALLYTMARHPGWIDVAHDQIAQGVMIIVVLLLWIRHVDRVRALHATVRA